MLYTAGPVRVGPDLVGVILIGTPLEAVTGRLAQEAVAALSAPMGGIPAAAAAVTPRAVHQTERTSRSRPQLLDCD